MPPFIKKSDADRFNPFFEYRDVNLTLKAASSDLNMAIRQFDAFFDKALVTNAVTMVRHKDRDLSNRLMQSADSAQRASSSTFSTARHSSLPPPASISQRWC